MTGRGDSLVLASASRIPLLLLVRGLVPATAALVRPDDGFGGMAAGCSPSCMTVRLVANVTGVLVVLCEAIVMLSWTAEAAVSDVSGAGCTAWDGIVFVTVTLENTMMEVSVVAAMATVDIVGITGGIEAEIEASSVGPMTDVLELGTTCTPLEPETDGLVGCWLDVRLVWAVARVGVTSETINEDEEISAAVSLLPAPDDGPAVVSDDGPTLVDAVSALPFEISTVVEPIEVAIGD